MGAQRSLSLPNCCVNDITYDITSMPSPHPRLLLAHHHRDRTSLQHSARPAGSKKQQLLSHRILVDTRLSARTSQTLRRKVETVAQSIFTDSLKKKYVTSDFVGLHLLLKPSPVKLIKYTPRKILIY